MNKEIPVIYSTLNGLHNPQFEIFNGEKKPHQDTPQRVNVILKALEKSGVADIEDCKASNEDEVVKTNTHDSNYLNYLKTTSEYAFKVAFDRQLPDFAIYPSIHPYVGYAQANNSISKRGMYIYDTYTPIMKDTYEVAVASATIAIMTARMLNGGHQLVYGLTRPSGHHALASMGGGMCYLNNVAIAANYLRQNSNQKIAVLDIDFHHGNGTQDIFYRNPDVLTISIHADPHFHYPHFSGYSEEIGEDDGKGLNKNLPLPSKTSNAGYSIAVQEALSQIKKFSPAYLLIAAGFDTHECDPLGNFKLTTQYYKELGNNIGALEIPTLVLQEGGYATENLGKNVVSFLSGLLHN